MLPHMVPLNGISNETSQKTQIRFQKMSGSIAKYIRKMYEESMANFFGGSMNKKHQKNYQLTAATLSAVFWRKHQRKHLSALFLLQLRIRQTAEVFVDMSQKIQEGPRQNIQRFVTTIKTLKLPKRKTNPGENEKTIPWTLKRLTNIDHANISCNSSKILPFIPT